jgi:methionyl-tRNA formyltransferase
MMERTMRLVFAGTPEFAMPTLEALVEAGHDVPLVVTQPDRPAGRGRHLHASPVKAFSVARRISVLQGQDINLPEMAEVIRKVEPEAMVVVAFGQKLSGEVLSLPKLGCFNVHASLLPAWRGAAPINRAIVHGDETTGVSVIRMNERIDAGEVLGADAVRIEPDWTAGDLSAVLAGRGARLMVKVLDEVLRGVAQVAPQDDTKVSRAPRLEKRHGLVPWKKSARDVHNHIRGMNPWPGAFTFLPDGRTGKRLRVAVLKSAPCPDEDASGAPGEVLAAAGDCLRVACGHGAVDLCEVKPAGSRAMGAADFIHGHAIRPGMRFTNDE